MHIDFCIVIERYIAGSYGSKRDKDGRLNMDAVSVSAQYTAEWLNNVERHSRAYSDTQDINKTQAAKVPRQPQH